MTVAQAINQAIKVFTKSKVGDLRTVNLMEGYGNGDHWEQIRIHIGYAIDGDYAESDKKPFEVKVYEQEGKINAERIECF